MRGSSAKRHVHVSGFVVARWLVAVALGTFLTLGVLAAGAPVWLTAAGAAVAVPGSVLSTWAAFDFGRRAMGGRR